MTTPVTDFDDLEPLNRALAADTLLFVCDFDGTIAEFSTDPMNVPVNADAIAALRRLGEHPDTEVVILSGRDYAGLKTVSGLSAPVRLVGSHGAEDGGPAGELTDAQRERLDAVTADLEALCARYPGSFVEHKPFHRVVHTRAVPEHEDTILAQAETMGQGLKHMRGKCIVEFSALATTKGTWVNDQRTAMENATGHPVPVIYIGDDVTDEDAFSVLRAGDVGIKVGDGATAAAYRVDGVPEAARFLTYCARTRG
ncbi:trehalose-phosphatase [Corynebacterium sp. 13CS0277]|uniref:trehalose-phosphatase n=1 Tax=Corynebacterium sp. 13CS0277 TaxID=2071994 RepID=UPI000D023196|nr:trehalose-phosphatase [Corynebacterium sp. 13CS0277]PRQ11509.1 trehalose-phosphatase [Corynebacterium sp. 13CS0277]